MGRRVWLVLALLILGLVASVLAFAAGYQSSSVTITGTAAPGSVTTTVPTGVSAKYGAAPSWSAVAKRSGTITAGDLFYIDATTNSANITVTLSLMNAGALQVDYRFINMEATLWLWNSGTSTWSAASVVSYTSATQNNPDLLSLVSGAVSWTVAGASIYEASISGGSFYCLTTTGTGGSLSPSFNANVQ